MIGRVVLLWQGGLVTNDIAVPLGLANSAVMGSDTSIGVSAGSNCGAGRTSGVRLAVVFFSWLLLHHVGAGDSADASHVVGTSGVSRSGRLTGWTRPHGGERAPDAPVMQSGQKAKSYQTIAMGVGAACLLLKSSSSATVGECMRCTCMVRVVGVCRRM